VDYWFYYFENGKKKEEGHFIRTKNANGGFYYSNEEINKIRIENGQMNCFLIYRSNQIIRAEKYIMGKKTKEWNLVTEFKKRQYYKL
jgi:hypothetical protein